MKVIVETIQAGRTIREYDNFIIEELHKRINKNG